jgi:hypothetical protein
VTTEESRAMTREEARDLHERPPPDLAIAWNTYYLAVCASLAAFEGGDEKSRDACASRESHALATLKASIQAKFLKDRGKK